MAKILILGSYGLLGSHLSPYLIKCGHEVKRQGRSSSAQISIDPSDLGSLRLLLFEEHFDVIINLVAATNVDQCERDLSYAYHANAGVVEVLSDAIRLCSHDKTPHLIHISTDQVYDGPGPHDEETVSPCNAYALSKLAGEIAAKSIGATILRTNFVGKSLIPERPAFSDWLVESICAQKPITLFDDVFFCPLHTSDLCLFIEKTVQLKTSGTFNLGCVDGISKAQFGISLAEILTLDMSSVRIGRSTDSPLRVKRPLDMRLNIARFEHEFGVNVPVMKRTIDLVAQEYCYE